MSQIERFCNQNEHVLRDLPELGFQGVPEGPRKVNTALFLAWRDEKLLQARPSKPIKLTFQRVAWGKVRLLTYLLTSWTAKRSK